MSKQESNDNEALQAQIDQLQIDLAASTGREEAALQEVADLKDGLYLVEEVEEKPRTVPKFYAGKIRGTYIATRRSKQHPFIPELKFGTDSGISHKQVGKVTVGSWLDMQLEAGVIRFEEEA